MGLKRANLPLSPHQAAVHGRPEARPAPADLAPDNATRPPTGHPRKRHPDRSRHVHALPPHHHPRRRGHLRLGSASPTNTHTKHNTNKDDGSERDSPHNTTLQAATKPPPTNGGLGRDVLADTKGDDRLDGNGGGSLHSGPGDDQVDGGPGDDTIVDLPPPPLPAPPGQWLPPGFRCGSTTFQSTIVFDCQAPAVSKP